MVVLAHQADSQTEARTKLEEVIDRGAALAKFREMISAQGGDPKIIDDPT